MQSPQAEQDIISSLGIHRVIEPKGSLLDALARELPAPHPPIIDIVSGLHENGP